MAFTRGVLTLRDREVARGPAHVETYAGHDLAIVAFEAILASLHRDGVGLRPEPLETAEPPLVKHVGRAERDDGWTVDVRSTDPIMHVDGLVPRARAAPPLPGFDPDVAPPPGVLARHQLRQLAAWSGPGCDTLRLRLEGAERFIAPLLEAVTEFGLAVRVSALHLWGLPPLDPDPLARRLPSLQRLSVPWWSWPLWDAEPFRLLEDLALTREAPLSDPPPPAQIVRAVSRRTPALRRLRLECPVDPAVLDALTGHRLPQRLDVLDLSRGAYGANFYTDLLARRNKLEDIETIHIRPPMGRAQRKRLAAWPGLGPVS